MCLNAHYRIKFTVKKCLRWSRRLCLVTTLSIFDCQQELTIKRMERSPSNIRITLIVWRFLLWSGELSVWQDFLFLWPNIVSSDLINIGILVSSGWRSDFIWFSIFQGKSFSLVVWSLYWLEKICSKSVRLLTFNLPLKFSRLKAWPRFIDLIFVAAAAK